MKTLTIFLILLCFVSKLVGQAPTAEKIDEFGKLGCCDFEARIHNFFIRLNYEPAATGYAVISGDNLGQRLYLERFVLDTIYEQNLDRTRVTMVREERQGTGPSVTFWLVPEGAEKPPFQEISLDFTLLPDRKPFLFADNSEPGVCPGYSLDLGHLSEFLQANPTARGNIVISSRVGRKEYRELRTKLEANARTANILLERLRFFRGETTYYSTVEIWLVPRRSRS